MLQKELAKRLKARYDTKMDGNGWLEVSSDGIPLCRIKYNGQYLSNADQNLSDEYRSKIADIQDEISTVREYVGLYEHAPQMKAADVSDYRQLAAFGDKEAIKQKMLTCVSEKYMSLGTEEITAQSLKDIFKTVPPLTAYDSDLTDQAVSEIQLKRNGTISLVLINGQRIGKEKSA